MKVLHYSNGRGFVETACGKSMHGWQGAATPRATDNPDLVECKRCLKELAKPVYT